MSTQPSFTYAAQEDQFHQLNLLVRDSGPPPPIVQFVNGLYGQRVEAPETKANLDWIPSAGSPDEESKLLYREVVRPYCRTYMSQIGGFSLLRLDDLNKQAAPTTDSVGRTHEMPVAEATLGLFWRSPARAYLVNALGLASPCAPEPL